MPKTALQEAMTKAGAVSPQVRLYNRAVELLRGANWNAQIARQSLVDSLQKEPDLLLALFGEAKVSEAALSYLQERAAEARPTKTLGGERGHGSGDTHVTPAPASRLQNGEGRGHHKTGALVKGAPSSPAKRDEDKGRDDADTHSGRAPSSRPFASGEGRNAGDNPVTLAAPARRPVLSSPLVKAKLASANSIFERSIGGDLKLGDATRIDLVNFRKKTMIAQHTADRLLTEIEWRDDSTPLRDLADEAQVKAILESSYRALDAIGATNHAG